MVSQDLMNEAVALKTKVDIMEWLSFFPEEYASLIRMQSKTIIDAFTRHDISPRMLDFVTQTMRGLSKSLDNGLKDIHESFSKEECGECNKCDELKDIIGMLLKNENIETVQQKMEERWGAIGGRPDLFDEKSPPLQITAIPIPRTIAQMLGGRERGRGSSEPIHIGEVINHLIMSLMRSMPSDMSSMGQPKDLQGLSDFLDDFNLRNSNPIIDEMSPDDKKKLH